MDPNLMVLSYLPFAILMIVIVVIIVGKYF